MTTGTLTACGACTQRIARDVRRCPACGTLTPMGRRARRRWLFVALIAAVLVVAVVWGTVADRSSSKARHEPCPFVDGRFACK